MKEAFFPILWFLIALQSCKVEHETIIMKEEPWKLGWRMIENSWNLNYELADLQFDSLRSIHQHIDKNILLTGLGIKSELLKEDEIIEIIAQQTEDFQIEVCMKRNEHDANRHV